MVQLGDKVRDPITTYVGIAYERVTYLQGCDRIGIQAPIYTDKDGALVVPHMFYCDEPQLVVVKNAVKEKAVKKEGPPGGPSGFGPSTKR